MRVFGTVVGLRHPITKSPSPVLLPRYRLSRTLDTAGEFVRDVWNHGFASPVGLILPKFRPNDPRWEFASSITLDDPDQPAGNEALQFAGDSGPTLVGNGPSSSRVRESPSTGEVNTLLDARPELALHKGGYAT